jgi:hypothetical protein
MEIIDSGRNNGPLDGVTKKRVELGRELLNVDLLKTQAGSQDLGVAGKAQNELMRKWDLLPGNETEKAETVDLMKQLEQFSESEREKIISNLAFLQLTEGCNGNCYFCFLGNKGRVEAKYSFDSVKQFFEKYGEIIPNDLTLYSSSDPFDYRDGGKNFTDIYKLWEGIKPTEPQYISTSIPRGGEDDFIDFFRYIARTDERPKSPTQIRISVGEHNIQRVEATLIKLNEALKQDGCDDDKREFLYAKIFRKTAFRFDGHIKKMGPLTADKERDDVRDIEAPGVKDGVLISPKSIESVIMITPTIYEPSGEWGVVLSSGKVEGQVPKLLYKNDYVGSGSSEIMLDIIRNPDRREFKLSDVEKDIVLKLGRETKAIRYLIKSISDLPTSSVNFLSRPVYLKRAEIVFRERRIYTESQLERANNLLKWKSLPEREKEEVEFNRLLTEVNLAEMDFLADQIKAESSIRVIFFMASVFRNLGREQVEKLPNIFKYLDEFSENHKRDFDQKLMERAFLEIVGKPLNF